MSPNERRGRLKIVVPPKPKEEKGLSGGLKNALDRGESLEKAKQSFLNAGYKSEEIEDAVQKMPKVSPIKKQISTIPEASSEPQKIAIKTKPLPINLPKQEKKLSKKVIIILVFISILIIVGAAILGIFWDRIV